MTKDPTATMMNQRGRRFFGMTLEGWSLFTNASFFVLSALALAAAISVFFVARANDRAKDRQVAVFQTEAEARIGEANKEAAMAHKEAADANVKAGELRLQVEQLRSQLAPRLIDKSAFLGALSNAPKSRVEVLYQDQNNECYILANFISGLLSEAGWMEEFPQPIADNTKYLLPRNPLFDNMPLTLRAGGQGSGVSITSRDGFGQHPILPNPEQIADEGFKPSDPKIALWTAFARTIGSISGGGNQWMPPDLIRIVVAPRL